MPGFTDLPSSVGKLEQLVDFIADSWRRKDWVRWLMLVEFLLLLLNPSWMPKGLELLGLPARLPDRPWLIWAVAVAAVFLAALVVAVHRKARTVPAATAERLAIKGLVAFEREDAEVFARLQREQELQECLVALTSREFRFGYLNGESGSGKTSFLQAGLWPHLVQQGLRCVYVKFSDQEPERSVRLALAATDQPSGLADLLAAGGGEESPLVLLFDQFEQVFVQRPRLEREPFVQELATWYQGTRGPAKILLCLRSDFVGDLVELQKAMGYSLGPQQVFRLEKLEPASAAAVLKAMGEMAGMAVDEGFVEELAWQELADRKDGLVSPVDLQVLAWMIAGQRTVEERAFSRDALRKMGGVEGLLERFLERALAVRETEARRLAAIKVLLLLTDLDQNVRAGLLTAAQLAEKKDASLSAEDLREALDWLARPDVRLVARAEREGETVYELAHERLIPALRHLANRDLTDEVRAGLLLDRRVNEWLGNGRAARYLLTWRELRLIERMRPYLHWGPQEAQKRELIGRSRRRRNLWLTGVAAAAATALAVVLWWRSPWGELWQAKRDLAGLARELPTETLSIVAMSFAAAGDDWLARRTVEQFFEGPRRLEPYLDLVRLSAAAGRPETALDFLERSRGLVETVEEKTEKSDAFAKVAGAALDAYEAAGDPSLWSAALKAAKKVESDKTSLYVRLAETGARANPVEALACLKDVASDQQEASGVVLAAVRLTEKTRNPAFLDPGIKAAANLDLVEGALVADRLLTVLAEAVGKSGVPRQKVALRKVLDGQHGKIERKSVWPRAERLAFLASLAAASGDPARSFAYVAEARSIVVHHPDSDLLWSLDLVAARLGKREGALAHLRRDIGRTAAADPVAQLDALPDLAERAAAVGEIGESLRLLSQAAEVLPEAAALEEKDDALYKARNGWTRLSNAAVRIGQQTGRPEFLVFAARADREAGLQNPDLLKQAFKAALELAKASRDPRPLATVRDGAEALGDVGDILGLARETGTLGDRRLAIDLLDRASRKTASDADLDEKAETYGRVAEAAAAIHLPDRCAKALDQGGEAAGRIRPGPDEGILQRHRSRALTFAKLAVSAGTVGDPRRASVFLERAGQAMQEHAKSVADFPPPANIAEWWKLADRALQAGDRRRAAEFLEKGFTAAQEQHPSDSSSWLAESLAASRAGELGLARRSADHLISEVSYRAVALICILAHRAEERHPKVSELLENVCQAGVDDE